VPVNEDKNVDDRAESDLAWELADAIGRRVSDRQRTRLYAAIGSGDSYTAIDLAMQALVRLGLSISTALVIKLASWLDAYAHCGDASRLHELLDIIESNARLRPK